jgi:hypothetical protein
VVSDKFSVRAATLEDEIATEDVAELVKAANERGDERARIGRRC